MRECTIAKHSQNSKCQHDQTNEIRKVLECPKCQKWKMPKCWKCPNSKNAKRSKMQKKTECRNATKCQHARSAQIQTIAKCQKYTNAKWKHEKLQNMSIGQKCKIPEMQQFNNSKPTNRKRQNDTNTKMHNSWTYTISKMLTWRKAKWQKG